MVSFSAISEAAILEVAELAGNKAARKALHLSLKVVAFFWLYSIIGVFSSFLYL